MLTMITAAVIGQSKEIVDDIYFKPGDAIKQSKRPVTTKKPVYKNGAKEIVFIERGQKVEIVTPDTTVLLGEANDSTEQEKGYYLNGFNGTQSDMEYAERIRKFHNPKYRVFIGDPAYNDIYFLNNFDWNVYVEDNYAYVTPTWTNPYWFDYTFSPNSYWGWNRWGYGYPYYGGYGGYYGWGNYPWAYNNYWGGYGGMYGGWYGSYYGGMYGYGMGYPYYGYGGYHHGFYDGYWYGNYYGGGYSSVKDRSRGEGTRQPNNLRTTIGGGGTLRDAGSVRGINNYTAVGESNRSIVSSNGSRSIRSAADFENRSNSAIRTFTERNTTTFGGGSDRQTSIRTTENNFRTNSGYVNQGTTRSNNSFTTRESGIRPNYTTPRVSTTPRTGASAQPNQGARGSYSTSSPRSGYSTGTPNVNRESGSSYSSTPNTSTRSSYNSSSSSSSGSSYRSSSPSYSSGSSSSYSSGGGSYSGGSSSGSSSGGGGRR